MCNLNHPEVTARALDLLRNPNSFQWYVVALLALVFYVYFREIKNKNWNGIAAGLSLYMLHWTAEIVNGLIQHFSGHALWTIPEGTAFLLLIGVGVELSFMFAIMGLVFSMLLPDKPKVKVLGVPNRVFFAVVNAVVCSIAELILSKTPFFVWIYPWWGVVPVFFLFYVPAFLVSMYSFDWKRKTQKVVIGTMFGINVVMLIVFAGILGWI